MQPLLLVLALCAAPIFALPRPEYTDDYSDEDTNAWQPEPLKPAPWQAPPPLPPPRSAPPPPPPRSAPGPQEAVVPVPGIGQIVGVRGFKNIGGRPVNAFLGLRYGQVGSGLARFQAAQPASLQGRIDATVQSPNCAQFPELQRLRESESRGENVDDCLTLNIYAPEGARDLPVLVFVHGEMLFDGGAEEAQPDYVLEKDVLLVSINYRLAPFGFLSALSDELPGNVALSDLQLALEWLQRNLVHFGGNPGQVTLAGQAGGATLVHALSLSGRGANLFQQLILQSGTALNPYLIDERPLETLDTFARLARCPPANPGAARSLDPLYECLARLPTSQLVSAFEQLFEQNEPRGLSFLGGFKLVVGDRLGYLPRPPAALAANASNSVPTIIGAAKDASAFILSRFYNQIAGLQSRNVSDYIDVVLRHTAPPSDHRIWKQWALREIFSPDQVYSASARTVSQGLLELSNLILYRAPVIYSIRQSYRSTPVYLYTFDYRGEHHRFGHLDNPLPFGVDASLSDDSVYLFPYPEEASRLNPEDRSLSRALVTMWVNFAVTGVPNPNSGVWPRATSEYGPFLRFTNSRQNMLELDPHFGEGINLPNLYGEYFNATNTSSAAVAPVAPPTRPTYSYPTPSTTTTTTTTRRPYAYNPYANWQNRQPQQPQQPWRPANPDYVRAQEERQAQFIREQQERAQREREQRWREQQARDNQNSRPAQDPREQQRLMQERERQQRLQQERERQQREQQEREQQQREQQQQEQQERERQQREQQEREQQEREQQERERQEREQQEREKQEREHQARNENPYPSFDEYLQKQQLEEKRLQQEREQREREQQPDENPEDKRQDYPSFEDYLRSQQGENPSEREQQEREEQEREQQEREQQEREHQARNENPYPSFDEYLQEHRLEEERLEQERAQREREEQPAKNPKDERQDYPSYEDYLRSQQGENPPDSERERNYNEEQEREQQQREQQEREQQEREQQEREQQEREQREREQQEREPQPDSDDPQNYPSYEDYLRAHQAGQPAESDPTAEEQEREQERRDQLELDEQEHGDPFPNYDEYERSQEDNGDQEPSDPANDPSSYPSYEDYVRAQQKLREEEEERDRAREAQERAEAEQEESRQEYPGHLQFRGLLRGPQHIKLMHRQQRRRQ